MDEQKVPTRFWVMAFLAVLIAGPVAFFSFFFGGPTVGAVAVLCVAFFLVALYIIVVRRYF